MMAKFLDLATADDDTLADFAGQCFRLGLSHGRREDMSTPITADALMAVVPMLNQFDRRLYHKRKLRQVYGAGYDIARAMYRAGPR